MSLELRVVSGQRSGTRERFEKSVVSVGRHPLSDLRFDPYKDLDVSTRHAELRGIEGVWTIHDQRSTNGTFVNGQRVDGERVLRHGDLITFGANGPRVEVYLPSAAAALVMEASAPPAPRAEEAPAPITAPSATSERLVAAIDAQTHALRNAFLVGMALIVVALAIGAYVIRK